MIRRNVARELPFMATEAILMAGVKAGGDRQALHEQIRRHSMEAAQALMDGAEKNDLLDRIAGDPAFSAVREGLVELTDPMRFVGRAPAQVSEFIKDVISPIREKYAGDLGAEAELRV